MYGSDWPVCLFAGSYDQAFRLVDDYASVMTEAERADLFGDNCARFYFGRRR
jgi:L-fuconolactonase